MRFPAKSELVLYILAFAIILILTYRYMARIPEKPTLTQDLEDVLLPIKSAIGERKYIAVRSNNPSLELFFNAQFALVPMIAVRDSVRDSVLYIEDLKLKHLSVNQTFKHGRILAMKTGRRFRAMLIETAE
jgi:hypothetical protein